MAALLVNNDPTKAAPAAAAGSASGELDGRNVSRSRSRSRSADSADSAGNAGNAGDAAKTGSKINNWMLAGVGSALMVAVGATLAGLGFKGVIAAMTGYSAGAACVAVPVLAGVGFGAYKGIQATKVKLNERAEVKAKAKIEAEANALIKLLSNNEVREAAVAAVAAAAAGKQVIEQSQEGVENHAKFTMKRLVAVLKSVGQAAAEKTAENAAENAGEERPISA